MQRRHTGLWSAVVFVLGAAASASAWADHTFCVTSSAGVGSAAQLIAAFTYSATASDETVYIHLEQGTYTLVGSQSYNQDFEGGNANLHVVGGFVPGTQCKTRALDPANTIVQGAAGPPGSDPSGLQIGQEQGELLVDGIEFKGFASGLDLFTAADSTVTARNLIITGMGNADGLGALEIETQNATGGSSLRVENCLIYGNATDAALRIFGNHGSDSVQILNSTITGNSGWGLYLGDSFDPMNGTLVAYNDVIWNNGAGDIATLYAVNTPTIDYSDFNSISGPKTGAHDIDQDPQFVNPGAAEFEIATTSPVVNHGAAATLVAGGYADTDIRGRTRVIGSRIDMGAYETLVDDTAPQTVSLTADTPTGATLRAAITTANSNPNPTTIVFDITNDGDCPHYINLGSVLPDITSDITIDGYTQPGAAPNSTAPGYNGSLCIILYGFGVDHGLQVGSGGRLTVRGIEFEDFAGAAVHLGTGAGHVVTGNGFSQTGGPVSKYGVLIDGTATASQIGSYAFGDRNVFRTAGDAAIELASNGAGHHLIQGNYIGFAPDGTAPIGGANKYGIYAAGSGANEISYNYIGNSTLYALYFGGTASSGNRVVENGIGYAPADGSAAGNGAGNGCLVCFPVAAVEITSGAHDNYVGALGGSGGNNVITNNAGGGVYVDPSGGTGNRIYGNNRIYANGGNLAIDLGGLGPTANDNGDGDTGGNNLQNYPILSQATRIEADVMRVGGFLQVEFGVAKSYRLDFYWTDSCLAPGDGTGPRGELKKYVGFLNLYSDGSLYLVPFSTTDILAAVGLPHTGYVFAIATDSAGNTSEPGPCHGYFDDYIFTDGF